MSHEYRSKTENNKKPQSFKKYISCEVIIIETWCCDTNSAGIRSRDKRIAPEPELLIHRLLASGEGMPSTLVGTTVKTWFGVLYLQ